MTDGRTKIVLNPKNSVIKRLYLKCLIKSRNFLVPTSFVLQFWKTSSCNNSDGLGLKHTQIW